MVKINGIGNHQRRLLRMTSGAVRQKVNQALYAAGQEIEIEAELSITEGSVSGKNHVPSLPGEPPNADTRQLDTNINTIFVGDLHVEVEATAPYAEALEVGTSKMAARPFMGPAAAKKGPNAVKIIARAVAAVLRGK